MKKVVVILLMTGALSLFNQVFASPPPPPVHAGTVHAGHAAPPPMRMHNRVHGGVSFNTFSYGHGYRSGNYYGNYRSIGCGNCYCPCYGVCRPFRHPGPQYSSGFYISF